MQAYVMMTNSISGMGGGQMYVNNKALFMRSKGWSTYIVSCQPGDILIPGLKEYERYIDIALISPFAYSTKKVRQKVEDLVKSMKLDEYDEVIVESGFAHMAYWAELLAKRVGGRHFAYLLDERNDLLIPEEYLSFFDFKLQRRELAGINVNSLPMLFRHRADITGEKRYHLPAVCQNVVEDCDHRVLREIRSESIVLCCLGRLEKPFIAIAVDAFVQVAQQHPESQFDIVIVGGSSDDVVTKRIINRCEKLENAKLIMPGHIFPLPHKLFEKVDIVISSAGSAGVAYREGAVTVSVDGHDGMAIGVLGYTTQNTLYREKEDLQDVATLVDKVLFQDYLKDFQFTPNLYKPEINQLAGHITFLDDMDKTIAYYDFRELKLCKKDILKRLICTVMDVRVYLRVSSALKRLKLFVFRR